ncbi:hypothetical protein ACXEHW_005169 [Klebsiella variicola]|nr:hypothetical protein [Klebsiella variicola]HCI6141500.1 hypothetical protein [Klebsiella variicola subsp. variicola]
MVVHAKPKDRTGYSAINTEMCERILVTLLTTFGTMKGTLRLIGGLVPRYLTPAQEPQVPEHYGTSDDENDLTCLSPNAALWKTGWSPRTGILDTNARLAATFKIA